jgi:sec-independent protein translocase protein TatB
MFGVSFSELALIFIVALVVLGPTRLPGLVRKVGRWVGKARAMARDFQNQLETEINIDELNRMTDIRSKETPPASPAPSAEFSGDMNSPPATDSSTPESTAPESTAPGMAESGYPYGVQQPAPDHGSGLASDLPPDHPPDAAPPLPGDDNYSHAHAYGDAPMSEAPVADEPAPDPANAPKNESGVA